MEASFRVIQHKLITDLAQMLMVEPLLKKK